MITILENGYIDSINKGLMALYQRSTITNSTKFDNAIEKQIVDIASSHPRTAYGLGFSSWSLRILAGFIMCNLKLVDRISHTEIRNILLKHKIKWRKSKTVLSKSNDLEYTEKKYIEQLRYDTPKDSILLYLDEKVPITAKTSGGTSWLSI